MNDKTKLIKIGSYFDIKGSFYIESRNDNNSYRPKINFTTRRNDVLTFICNFLNEYNIKYSVVKTFKNLSHIYTLRISDTINCFNFIGVFDEFITFKSEEYLKLKTYVLSKYYDKNNKLYKY